ncbi:MAG TPA: alpha/beta fold hydrolase [Ramlibacter sp.]|nr:alpha/beta fold hydrolase [Ramlibacter sp.]
MELRTGMLALSAALLAGCASTADPAKAPIALESVRGYHVGGERKTLSGLPIKEVRTNPQAPVRKSDPNGDYQVGQLYVQHFALASPKAKVPMLLWHGGGLTGVTWETTPDGRSGWHEYFMRAGYDTLVSDAVERGRSTWARYPEINPGDPEHRTIDQAWGIFRFGPADGYSAEVARQKTYAGMQFPVADIDQFTKQFVARWTTSDAWIQSAYDALVQRVCPCVIVGHSQAGQFVYTAAQRAPDKVKAVVLIEPASGLDPAKAEPARVKHIPHLTVWGDYLKESALWTRYRNTVETYTNAIKKAGGTADTIDLPALGIRGNSHMVMMDRNSDQVARLVRDWLVKQGIEK